METESLHADHVKLHGQEWNGRSFQVKWQRSLSLTPASPQLSHMRLWLKDARRFSGSSGAKDVSKLRCHEVMEEIAAFLKKAGVNDSIISI